MAAADVFQAAFPPALGGEALNTTADLLPRDDTATCGSTMRIPKVFFPVLIGFQAFTAALLGSGSLPSVSPGLPFIVPSWDIQSSTKTGNGLASLSRTGVDVASWHHVAASRCTLMDCLLVSGAYREDDLFFSDNLAKVDRQQFAVPWLYRNEFCLDPLPGQHYFLETHGITSKADILLNGQQIATKDVQVGAYASHTFDITKIITHDNALLVQAYPTDYNYDFAMGFVDWNPYPPDNGTGVWRELLIKETGPVALGPLRITTEFDLPVGKGGASVTLHAQAKNLEDREVTLVAESIISGKPLAESVTKSQTFKLGPLQTMEISVSTTLDNPAIWWPNAWGEQPLYVGQLGVSENGALSDMFEKSFGIRKVTKVVNEHNDTMFSINGKPFQVIGGGYSADMFMRWDDAKFETQAQYMLDLGHNTVRLEGKMEQPQLYEIADRLGLMVLPGWECCDKWEAWAYNDDLAVKDEWDQTDYATADASMRHEAGMLQSHPSILGFLVGSDYWPDDKATSVYLKALQDHDWQTPVIASAAKRGYPEALGPSGMKMAGPYDWVPPNYWYDTEPAEDRLGAAFGFGSELGAGVGTPELSSLKKFLSDQDLDDLWKQANKGLYHMSTSVSQFYTREIYNEALWSRFGAPTSLEDYLLKAQILDYEATRAQFEGFSALWNAKRPATGLIYWMLQNAWPSLHWNLFDYYLHPAGSYFGAKLGARLEHVAYDYVHSDVYLINHSIDRQGARTVEVEIIATDGKVISSSTTNAQTEPNTSKNLFKITSLSYPTDVVFLRLVLLDANKKTISRNVYWLAKTIDSLNWDNSTWYHTPVTQYADFKSLNTLQTADVSVATTRSYNSPTTRVFLENRSSFPAFFLRLNLVDKDGQDVLPVFWSDNYVTLWPHEKLELEVTSEKSSAAIQVSGKNIDKREVRL